nr:MAG TPA: hypothetical protein [Caudoviricetes sp.]
MNNINVLNMISEKESAISSFQKLVAMLNQNEEIIECQKYINDLQNEIKDLKDILEVGGIN